MVWLHLNDRRLYSVIFLLILFFLVSCEAEQDSANLLFSTPTRISSPTLVPASLSVATPTSKLNPDKDSVTTDPSVFENLPKLYLTIDPVIPPFNSKLISLNPATLVNYIPPQKANLLSDDYNFLGRDPNLTWSPDYSKAVFLNYDGVYLFSPDTSQFSPIYSDRFAHLPVFWNYDNHNLIFVVDNGKEFSGDILLLKSDGSVARRFEFPVNWVPRLLEWIDEQTALTYIDIVGAIIGSQKMGLIDRKLYKLNIQDGTTTEVKLSDSWLLTEGEQLSPNGKSLFFRSNISAPGSNEGQRANLLDLQTNTVEILDLPEGEFKWLPDSEGYLLIDRGLDNPEQILWFKNGIQVQNIAFETGSRISSILLTPEGDGIIVFLTNYDYFQPENLFGYKGFFIMSDGSKRELTIPGLDSADWRVVFTSWGQRQPSGEH